MNDLFDMLTRMGIEPLAKGETSHPHRRFTEHRIIEPTAAEPPVMTELTGIDLSGVQEGDIALAPVATGIALGDKVVLLYSDDQKRISVRLTDGINDLDKGRLSITSPLGKTILGAEEGDEVELPLENGRQRKVLIESVEKNPDTFSASPVVEIQIDSSAAVA